MARRFLIVYALSAALLTALLGAVNYAVDPYAMNGRVKAFAGKPELETHARIAKAFEILRRRPRELILGTSRAEFGLTTEGPGWRAPAAKRMNAAIAGATFYESTRFFEQALTTGELERAVIGLDFFAFNAYQRTPKSLNEDVFITGNSAWSHVTLALPFYLSADTLRSSLKTVRAAWTPAPAGATAPGDAGDFAFDAGLQGRGQRALFTNSEGYFLKYAYFPHPHGKFALRAPGMPSQLDDFERLLGLARKHNVRLALFISPVHARQLETIRAAGLWAEFENWKRALTAAVAADAAENPGAPRVELWDFSGFGSVQSEPVPPAGDTHTRMRGYRESSHYAKATGALVLAKVLRGSPDVPADFGVRLDAARLEAHLAHLRLERSRWAAAHPDDVQEIAGLAAEAGRP